MTMGEAITTAKEQSAERNVLGFDQVALDQAARQGFAEGAFEESEEEGAAVVEEFYSGDFDNGQLDKSVSTGTKPGLADKLSQKAAKLNGVEGAATVL